MYRYFDNVLLLVFATLLSCGPRTTQQQPTATTSTTTSDQVSEMTGGTCLEPDDVNSPWLVGLDATSRGTIARNAESGLVLVKQGECGTFQMLADCYIEDIQYKDKPAKILRPDAVEVSNRRQLQKKVPLAVAKYAAQMDDREHWSLDYVDAGEKSYSGSLPKIDWDKLRSSCRVATHYVYKVTRGAFQLSMVNEAEKVNEGNIGPADFKKRAERRKAEKSRDGDYAGCAASSDSSVSACGGLIRMWVEPIPKRLMPSAVMTSSAMPSPSLSPKLTDDDRLEKEGSDLKAGVEWKTIPGGHFQMGSDSGDSDEKPVHSVSVPTFQMTKTEVTLSQYKACVDAGKCEKPGDKGYCNYGYSNRGDHPINCVDWSQARQFCGWIGGRLPSEAEWEYAARGGGKDRKYPWGNTEASCSYAVMKDGGNGCGMDRTWPVCSKTRGNTSHGLCDMSGNVWEWVEDWYHDSYNGAPTNGDAWTAGGEKKKRVTRGDSWFYGAPNTQRTANRDKVDPSYRNSHHLGFRCTRDSN